VKDTFFCANWGMNFKGKLIEFQEPIVMGILNVTPDSFYSGSRLVGMDELNIRIEQMISDGVTIVDVGGFSSRPGADDVSIQDELERVIPVINEIHRNHPELLISIDTFRSSVAKAAIEAGASMINDISGGEMNKDIYSVAAESRVPYVMMHMRGTPSTMQSLTDYDNLLKDILEYFSIKIQKARAAGIKDIIIDPGFGFSKELSQNFEMLNNLEMFQMYDLPILAGLSRKSMIYKTLETTPKDSLNGTTAINSIALMKGARILRVHDVKEAKETIRLLKATFTR
jgi:dihydropteroate synthase